MVEASQVVAVLLAAQKKGQRPPALVFAIGSAHTELWGFSRTARNEYKQLNVFAAAEGSLEEMLLHLSRTSFQTGEFELHEGAQIPRLFATPLSTPPPAQPASAASGHYRLHIARPAQLQSLCFSPVDIAKVRLALLLPTSSLSHPSQEGLGPNEVRINTAAIALHFKDVMLAMNMLPGFKPVLGLECSGVVAALGAEATKKGTVKVGDKVLAVAMSAAPSRSTRKSMMGSTVVCEAHEVLIPFLLLPRFLTCLGRPLSRQRGPDCGCRLPRCHGHGLLLPG